MESEQITPIISDTVTLADFSIPIRTGVTPTGRSGYAYLSYRRQLHLNRQLNVLRRHRSDAARSLLYPKKGN